VSHPNPSSALAWVIVDELARRGVTHSVVSPGSRSTALVLALNSHPDFSLVMHIDERSAGFRALGSSVATASPVLVATTSGSAVANLLPAVVEADRSAIPMIVLTADRPAAMVERRANQTMDQKSVFSGYVRRRVDLGPAVDSQGEPEEWRIAVSGAVAAARGSTGSPGPVHINVAFEEPTVPVSDDGRMASAPYETPTDSDGASEPSAIPEPEDLPATRPGSRPIVIAGRGDYDIQRLLEICSEHGIPVLSTALSGGRGGEVISSYHHLLVSGTPHHLLPDWVLVVGQPGPSDRLASLMTTGAPVIHVDRWGQFSDISGTMTEGVRSDPVGLLSRIAVEQEPGWSTAWRERDRVIRAALDEVLDSADAPTGPGIARELNHVDWTALVVASSLPIRDVDSHLVRPGRVHSNRGVSGIDGFASTALGIASYMERTLAMVGDLSFLHDSNAFLTDAIPPVVFVVVDNQGGGLFDLLPQARFAPDFDRLFVTPPRRDLSTLAGFHGLDFVSLESVGSLRDRVGEAITGNRATLVRVPVDRSSDVAMRKLLDDAAREVSVSGPSQK
jgi:2-succinyl-5-enolpyruvyl-6-hydroxy-3-cyclohexene-1-carboxylate synthase